MGTGAADSQDGNVVVADEMGMTKSRRDTHFTVVLSIAPCLSSLCTCSIHVSNPELLQTCRWARLAQPQLVSDFNVEDSISFFS